MCRRPQSRFLVVAGPVAVTCLAFLYLAKRIVLPEIRFPSPNGPHSVGTVTRHWVDTDRREILGASPAGPRELMVDISYPAEMSAGPRLAYIPDSKVVVPALARVFKVPRVALHHLGRATTNAVAGPAATAGPERFPVVLLLSGLGGFRQAMTFLAEELVSQGYVVVAVDHPYTAAAVAFPDGRAAEMDSIEQVRPFVRQSYLPAAATPTLGGEPLKNGIVPFLGADVSFVLDQLELLDRDSGSLLAGRLDLTRIGVAGVSLGGLVAGEAAREDERISAALILDAAVPLRTVRSGLDVPSMWITRPRDTMRLERHRAGGWGEEEIEAHHSTTRATFEGLRAPGYLIQIPLISHVDFTDAPLWSPAVRWIGMSGPRDGAYAHSVISAYSVAFFQRHLGGTCAPLLDQTSPAYPDVSLEVHRPAGMLEVHDEGG